MIYVHDNEFAVASYQAIGNNCAIIANSLLSKQYLQWRYHVGRFDKIM